MSTFFHIDPHSNDKSNSFLSQCGIYVGSAFFVLILSIGAYHYFYKGIPDYSGSSEVNAPFHKALSSLTTPKILDYVDQDGHLVFTYNMPKTGPVYIKVLNSTGDTIWQDEHIREKGRHGFELPQHLLESQEDYTIILNCRGKESEFPFSPS